MHREYAGTNEKFLSHTHFDFTYVIKLHAWIVECFDLSKIKSPKRLAIDQLC